MGIREVWEYDQNRIDAVQARCRHDTPRNVENLSGAQHNERLRLLGNGAEQQARILEVVRVQKNTARHLSMA